MGIHAPADAMFALLALLSVVYAAYADSRFATCGGDVVLNNIRGVPNPIRLKTGAQFSGLSVSVVIKNDLPEDAVLTLSLKKKVFWSWVEICGYIPGLSGCQKKLSCSDLKKAKVQVPCPAKAG